MHFNELIRYKKRQMQIKKITLACMVLTLFGCNNEQLDSKNLVNSYLINVSFELSAYSKPIKKQVITGNRLETFESCPDGFFTSFDLGDLNILIDYENQKFIYNTNGNIFEYKINFDDKNNILSMEDSQGKAKLLSTFDEQGRVIKVENSAIGDAPYIFITQFFYQKSALTKSTLEIRQKVDE